VQVANGMSATNDSPAPNGPATRRELREELEAVLKALATKEDLKAGLADLREELRTHFKVMLEELEKTGKIFYEGLRSAQDETHALVKRIEKGHGERLTSLETRVTRIENSPKRR
jgi:hypothetical protein